jgi:hypothetical protein
VVDDHGELVFPDWSAMPVDPPRLSLEQAYQRCLEAMRHESLQPGFEERRLALKVREPFRL